MAVHGVDADAGPENTPWFGLDGFWGNRCVCIDSGPSQSENRPGPVCMYILWSRSNGVSRKQPQTLRASKFSPGFRTKKGQGLGDVVSFPTTAIDVHRNGAGVQENPRCIRSTSRTATHRCGSSRPTQDYISSNSAHHASTSCKAHGLPKRSRIPPRRPPRIRPRHALPHSCSRTPRS